MFRLTLGGAIPLEISLSKLIEWELKSTLFKLVLIDFQLLDTLRNLSGKQRILNWVFFQRHFLYHCSKKATVLTMVNIVKVQRRISWFLYFTSEKISKIIKTSFHHSTGIFFSTIMIFTQFHIEFSLAGNNFPAFSYI